MNVQEKRRLKKIQIMEAALQVWSEEKFQTTSLSLLASSLGMSKQGLYRYFKDKNHILCSLQDYIQGICTEESSHMIQSLQKMPYHDRFEFFVTSLIGFNITYPDILLFENFWIIKTGEIQYRTTSEQREEIQRLLKISEEERLFISMNTLFMGEWQKKRGVDLFLDLLLNGLGGPQFHLPPHPIRLEIKTKFQFFQEDDKKDRILQSISESIQEQGFRGVTLERIAEKANLSKSSLYNYFKNKDEMLSKTINRVIRKYLAFHSEQLRHYRTFEEKLMAHLEIQNTCFPIEPKSLILLRQLMGIDVLQKVEYPVNHPDYLTFIQDGIDQGKLKAVLTAREYQILFSSFIFIERFITDQDSSSPPSDLIEWLRLLAGGIKREKNETSDES